MPFREVATAGSIDGAVPDESVGGCSEPHRVVVESERLDALGHLLLAAQRADVGRLACETAASEADDGHMVVRGRSTLDGVQEEKFVRGPYYF